MAAWSALTAGLAVASGYVFAAPEWTDPSVPYWTAGSACAGLALAVVIGHLLVDPWWNTAVVWTAFLVGMVPPFAGSDALWIVAAMLFGVVAAGWIVIVNLVASFAVRRRRQRRSLHV